MKKRKQVPKVTELESLRQKTAYHAARTWLATPFVALGILLCSAAGLCAFQAWQVVIAQRSGLELLMLVLPFCLLLMLGFFCFGVVALAGAVFDVADCALRQDTRAKLAEALAAQEARQKGLMRTIPT